MPTAVAYDASANQPPCMSRRTQIIGGCGGGSGDFGRGGFRQTPWRQILPRGQRHRRHRRFFGQFFSRAQWRRSAASTGASAPGSPAQPPPQPVPRAGSDGRLRTPPGALWCRDFLSPSDSLWRRQRLAGSDPARKRCRAAGPDTERSLVVMFPAVMCANGPGGSRQIDRRALVSRHRDGVG